MGLGYVCSFCSQQYPDPAELKIHTRSHGNIADLIKIKILFDYSIKLDITNLKCGVCHRSIDGLEKLMMHLEEHDKLIHTDINNHIIPFKFDTDVLTCSVCKEEFNYFKSLMEHIVRHYNNYECNVCGKGFINKRHLANHTARHELGVYNCKYCTKEFDSRIKVRTHERVVHRYCQKTRKCRYCTEKFITGSQRIKHEIAIHDVKPEVRPCKICDKTFDSQQRLDVHTKRQHLMLRPYDCTECDSSFFTKSDLREHAVKHTGENQYQCEVCPNGYRRKKSLVVHMRVHNNDRRFKCEYCDQSFIQKCSWKGHLRSKHGEIVF